MAFNGVFFAAFFLLLPSTSVHALDLNGVTPSAEIDDRRTNLTWNQKVDSFLREADVLDKFSGQFKTAAPPGIGGSCPVISEKELVLYQQIMEKFKKGKSQGVLEAIRGLDKNTSADMGILDKDRRIESLSSNSLPDVSSVNACSGAYKTLVNYLDVKSSQVSSHRRNFFAAFGESQLRNLELKISLKKSNPDLTFVSVVCAGLRYKIRKQMYEILDPFNQSFRRIDDKLTSISEDLAKEELKVFDRMKNNGCSSAGTANVDSSKAYRNTSTITSKKSPPPSGLIRR